MHEFRNDHPAPKAGFLFYKGGRRAKLSVLALFALTAVLLMSACGTAGAPQSSTTPTEEAAAAESVNPEPTDAPAEQEVTGEAEPSGFPLTETDILDRSVTIEEAPQRVVSLAPSATEILYAIGAGAEVVGRTEYDNYPSEVESLPSIGGYSASSISVEAILELEPDLIIAGDVSQTEIVDALQEAGLTVFVIQPNTVEEIVSTIQTLGKITGHADDAQTLVSDMESRISAVQETVKGIPENEQVSVFYEVWHEPLMTTSNQTFIGELVELAGGKNIFGDLDETYPTISAEQIIEMDPDVILGPSSHADQLTVDMIATRPGWEDLTAVVNSAVFIVDGDIVSRPGPRIVDALEAIAAELYPDLFNDS